MNAEELFLDKKFISAQLSYVPRYLKNYFSSDEIKSDLSLAICNCVKLYDPNRCKNISSYIRQSFLNNLKTSFRNKQYFQEMEVSLDAAHNKTYEDKEFYHIELMSYLSSLPNNVLNILTEFVNGEKNKEEIVSNPSFKKINIDRIIEKLDCLI